MQDFDFIFGGRIHGTMMGIQQGVPGLILAPDMRVRELSESMKIPFVTPFDKLFLDPDKLEINDIIEYTDFQSEVFDQNRCEVSKPYISHFADVGLVSDKSLQELCSLS